MKQVLLKKGQIYTAELPAPMVEEGMVLVRTAYSCISAGTEMTGVKNSGTPIVKRILEDPELMQKGLRMVKERGVKDTMAVVKGKYEVGAPMGYSAAGTVVESGASQFQIGDRVACMGVAYANHAGYIAVPKNLVVKIPDGVSFQEGATAALGCIAMQGVRRAEVRLGEYVVIMGLGILGQLASRFAVASGATVIATDIDVRRLEIAGKHGVAYTLDAKGDVVNQILSITGGHGADSVIVTAATSSHELLSQAFQSTRAHGRVVLVGVAGMNLHRDDMYKKELELRIATSYGPGRYDPAYEEGGEDYPYGYVRFTEQRNLESYLRLIAEKRIDISDIIERVYPVEQADAAYEALKADADRPLIVLLQYDEPENSETERKVGAGDRCQAQEGVIRVALCGAGGFAKGMHLPNLQKMKDKYALYAVQSRTGSNAQAIAVKYGASYSTTDYDQILRDPDVDMVMICTRHNTHADMVARALRAGKAVFVEKPMAVTAEEAACVMAAARESGSPFMVGFNRRFSRYAVEAKKLIEGRNDPMMVSYRMNAGFIPQDHWIQGKEGAGRIIGEGCHILDLFNYLTDSRAVSISVDQISPRTDRVSRADNVVITVKYEDGSVCTLLYTGQGSKDYGKEFCEIFCDGKVIVIDDYKKLSGYGCKAAELKSSGPEKGQYEELLAFYEAIRHGDGYPIPLWQLEQATMLSFWGQP